MEHGQPKHSTPLGNFLFTVGMIAAGCGMIYWLSREAAPPPPKTPEELVKEAAALRLDRARDKTVLFAKAVKDGLRDPDSVVWESVSADQDAEIICIEYRAKNGFGGMNREFVLTANGKTSQKVKDWNKKCLEGLNDMTTIIREI